MKIKLATMALGAALGVASIVPAFAAPGDNGTGSGGCIDQVYGNATNERPSGHGVLPSQSPGPWINTGFNEPPRDDRTRGWSIGDFVQFAHQILGLEGSSATPASCH